MPPPSMMRGGTLERRRPEEAVEDRAREPPADASPHCSLERLGGMKDVVDATAEVAKVAVMTETNERQDAEQYAEPQ